MRLPKDLAGLSVGVGKTGWISDDRNRMDIVLSIMRTRPIFDAAPVLSSTLQEAFSPPSPCR